MARRDPFQTESKEERGVGKIWRDKRRFYYFLLYKTLVVSALSQTTMLFL